MGLVSEGLTDMFENKLLEVQRLRAQKMNSQAVKECGTIIEQVLEKFYKDIWGHLNADEKQGILDVERKYSRKVNPVETLGLGNWIKFYSESGLPALLSKHLEIVGSAFDTTEIAKINTIRNKCTHEDYQATLEEAKSTYDHTLNLLMGTKLVKSEPVGIRAPQPFEGWKISDQKVWGDKIRLLLANEPSFEIDEPWEEDMGKSYYVQGKWDFVGVTVEDDIIRILLLEDKSSTIHEDIMDEVVQKVASMVRERIGKCFPDFAGFGVEVAIGYSLKDWGYYSEDIKF